jgi:hypothetical protein
MASFVLAFVLDPLLPSDGPTDCFNESPPQLNEAFAPVHDTAAFPREPKAAGYLQVLAASIIG